ncbi:MAG: IS30 family transposase [Sedimentisphaerales bacterium]|nr:IS30 family transposase [Sedimentisphaerales bacterium]
MGYGHLTIDEREIILKMRSQQESLQAIGERLGRSKGTISRELSRNVSSTHDYKAHLAQRYYEKRRRASKWPYRLEGDAWLCGYVQEKLKQCWSPEQISGRLHKDHDMDISPGTIYSWIYRNRSEGGVFYRYLRQSHRRRRKRRGGEDRRGQMPGRRMIDRRPQVVHERQRIGDWEGDTVEGRKGSGFIATHVERKSRYTVAVKVADKSAQTVTRATLSAMKKLPPAKVRTMTFDNGKEFAGFQELERGLAMRSYFARPYHSWERGANENTNGLLRQFFPKGMDFSMIDQTQVDRAQDLLNNRPRKCINYRTPAEVFWSKPKRCASD